MKLAVLSNINLDLYASKFNKDYDVFKNEGYANWEQYLYGDNKLFQFKPDIIVLIFDINNLSDLKNYKNQINLIFSNFQLLLDKYSATNVILSDVHFNKTTMVDNNNFLLKHEVMLFWYNKLIQLMNSNNNLIIFNLYNLINQIGSNIFYSSKTWYLGSIPYSMKGLEHLHHSTIELINKLSQKRLKVLALDFDNTLYGGVVGEDGYEGIIIGESGLGAIYRDVQYRIKRIKDSGIILVGLTKNNEEDMLSVFDNPNMILSKNDFVTVMANWDEKSQNIKKIANKLNLGLDSFVFLDDKYIERSKMSMAVPEVIVPDFPVDLSEYPVFLEEIYNRYFWMQNETKEDKVKTDQYSQEFKRSELSSKFDNLSDYLKSLDTKISISKLSKEQFERTLQLINKTNQFNLTTIRFNRSELLEFIENDNHIIYTVSVTDRFGSSGLVSVYMIKRNNDDAEVVNFIMSCRVMGRKIENGIVFSIENSLYDMGIKKIKTRYINTPKSDPVKDLWENLGYDLYKSDENSKEYEKILKNKNEIEDIYEITMEGKK